MFEEGFPAIKFISVARRKGIFNFRPPALIEVGIELASTSLITMIDNLVHVMIHIKHHHDGIVDSTKNHYHNQKFCDRALQLGLGVGYHKTYGWGLTYSDLFDADFKMLTKKQVPTTEATELLEKAYKRLKHDPPALEFDELQKQIKYLHVKLPQKQFQFRYVCGCEVVHIIRTGRNPNGLNPLDCTCNICGKKFVLSPKVSPVKKLRRHKR